MRRIASIIFLLLAGLAACKGADDPRAPFTDSRIPPGLEHRFYPPQGWAWGLIQMGKAPAVRYGVGAPAMTPRAQVLILPAYGEPAEAWFETARELIGRGCTVWILEAAGQGGSGRYALVRDLGHAPSLDADAAALLAFPVVVARSGPLFVVASGESAPVAVRAAALGLRANGLVLSNPVMQPTGDIAKARKMRGLGLGGLRVDGGHGWVRDEAAGPAETARRRLAGAWQAANPDLRMGDPSWSWRAAFADESQAAVASEARIAVPVLIAGQDGRAAVACGRIPRCSVVLGGAGQPLQFDADAQRNAWLSALLGFIDPPRGALAPAPAAVTVDPES